VTWHGNNLLALACHQAKRRRPYAAFVPPGAAGAVMWGWLSAAGCSDIVPLPRDGTGNVSAALKRMARNVRNGLDVVIALDGPRGPRQQARPGALWLARLTRAPLVPFGACCRPALRVPRWDRMLVPIPPARIAGALGPAQECPADGQVDEPAALRLGNDVSRLDAVAGRMLREGSPTIAEPALIRE
jgi:lysophospholipid acyltransferase (LPLAT)-like uncharacterized protein